MSTRLVSSGVLSCACAGPILEAPRGPHPFNSAATPIAVDSEPPSAEVENVPAAPNSTCLWADGLWRWDSGSWHWISGRWVVAKESCYYADSITTWVTSPTGPGTLYYTQGRWYDIRTLEYCPAPENCR